MSGFVRQRRRAQRTRAMVEVWDTHHPVSVLPDDGGRWLTICIDHGDNVNHPTLALARSHAAVPDGWCAGCATRARLRFEYLVPDWDADRM